MEFAISVILGFLGVVLGFTGIMVGRIISKETDELIKSEDERAKKIIAEGNANTKELMAQGEERLSKLTREGEERTKQLIAEGNERLERILERMDQSSRETREYFMSLILTDGERTREIIKEKILK